MQSKFSAMDSYYTVYSTTHLGRMEDQTASSHECQQASRFHLLSVKIGLCRMGHCKRATASAVHSLQDKATFHSEEFEKTFRRANYYNSAKYQQAQQQYDCRLTAVCVRELRLKLTTVNTKKPASTEMIPDRHILCTHTACQRTCEKQVCQPGDFPKQVSSRDHGHRVAEQPPLSQPRLALLASCEARWDSFHSMTSRGGGQSHHADCQQRAKSTRKKS